MRMSKGGGDQLQLQTKNGGVYTKLVVKWQSLLLLLRWWIRYFAKLTKSPYSANYLL